jgi:hypothetical protein
MPQISMRRICRVLEVPRSATGRAVAASAGPGAGRPLDALLVERIEQLIGEHPTYGYRRLWANAIMA